MMASTLSRKACVPGCSVASEARAICRATLVVAAGAARGAECALKAVLSGFTGLCEQHAHRLLDEEPASRSVDSGGLEFVWPYSCHEGSTSQDASDAPIILSYAASLAAAERRDQSRYTGTPNITMTKPGHAVCVLYSSKTNSIASAATI